MSLLGNITQNLKKFLHDKTDFFLNCGIDSSEWRLNSRKKHRQRTVKRFKKKQQRLTRA